MRFAEQVSNSPSRILSYVLVAHHSRMHCFVGLLHEGKLEEASSLCYCCYRFVDAYVPSRCHYGPPESHVELELELLGYVAGG